MIRTALDDIGAVLSLLLTLAAGPAVQSPALQPPPCASRAALDDLLARSASAFNARDAVQGLALLQQAFDRATADECVLERAEALRRLALADEFDLRFDDARQKLDEAAGIFRRFGVTLGEAQSRVPSPPTGVFPDRLHRYSAGRRRPSTRRRAEIQDA